MNLGPTHADIPDIGILQSPSRGWKRPLAQHLSGRRFCECAKRPQPSLVGSIGWGFARNGPSSQREALELGPIGVALGEGHREYLAIRQMFLAATAPGASGLERGWGRRGRERADANTPAHRHGLSALRQPRAPTNVKCLRLTSRVASKGAAVPRQQPLTLFRFQ